MAGAAASAPAGSAPGEKGLKSNAIGYLSNVVIAIASVAPGYSIAATLGYIVLVKGMGVQAPAIMIVSFIPMLLIASAYRYMNKADPDAGTSFSWVTRGMGPHLGWMAGWGIVAADIIVMAALAQIAASYTFLLFGWDSAAGSTVGIIIAGSIWIAVMTAICYIGIELNAKTQRYLLAAEVVILTVFSVVALIKVYANNPAGSIHPAFAWFNPFQISSTSALADGVLLGTFIYWGWDSGVAVNEESESAREGPGRAAVVSTIGLLLIYLIVSSAAQAYGGPKLLGDNPDDVLSVLGAKVFGTKFGLDKLLILAVLTSAAASTQTTILPTARTTLSMAFKKAIPARFGEIHARFQTPSFSTIVMGVVSTVWFALLIAFNPSGNVLGDAIAGLGFAIAFYYGITGFACAIYYRRELTKSVRNFVFAGVAPVLGGLALTALFVKAFHDFSQKDYNYSKPLLGIQTPIVIGIGSLLLGVVLLVFAHFRYREFFSRKPQTAPPGLLEAPVEHVRAHL